MAARKPIRKPKWAADEHYDEVDSSMDFMEGIAGGFGLQDPYEDELIF